MGSLFRFQIRKECDYDMYLTVKELAERLKVKPVTIYKWCREGYFDIAKINLSGTIRFEENKLEDCFDKLRAR